MPERDVDDLEVPRRLLSIAQSSASITLLVNPEPSAAHRLQADDVRAGRDVADDAGDVRAVAVLVPAARALDASRR